jgi:hypothetical protein
LLIFLFFQALITGGSIKLNAGVALDHDRGAHGAPGSDSVVPRAVSPADASGIHRINVDKNRGARSGHSF